NIWAYYLDADAPEHKFVCNIPHGTGPAPPALAVLELEPIKSTKKAANFRI
ncbi:unnamed protein product, partial [marine sediment metagenome]